MLKGKYPSAMTRP